MTKKKPSKKSTTRTRKPPPEPEQLSIIDSFRDRLDTLNSSTRSISIAGAALIAIVALLVGFGALESRASILLQTPDPFIEILWPHAPGSDQSWLPIARQTDLLALASEAARQQTGAFSPAQLRTVGENLDRTGWFKSPPTVRRISDGVIQVSGQWRLPAATVRYQSTDYLVAWDAARLPIEYKPGESGLPIITGVAATPPSITLKSGTIHPNYKEPWPGDGVAPALALLRILVVEPFSTQVTGIDTANPSAMGGLTITTDKGTNIIWGSPPGDFRPGETNTNTKLQRLTRLYRDFGRIDAGRQAIDISGSQPVEIDHSADSANK